MTAKTTSLSLTLSDRVVIVTGAGKGIGRAVSLSLGRSGAKVLVNNRRHPGQLDADTSAAKVVAQIQAEGGQAQANHADALDPDSGVQMVEQALNRQ